MKRCLSVCMREDELALQWRDVVLDRAVSLYALLVVVGVVAALVALAALLAFLGTGD